jgi:hypothetical protein
MADAGVTVAIVLQALKATPGVSVVLNADGSVTIIKDGKLDIIYFELPIEKKMLFRLEFRYGTPIHWFWRPDMIPDDKKPS